MKKAHGYFKPAYTNPHHYPDDVIAPVASISSRHQYISDVVENNTKETQQQPQHVADAPSSSFASLSSFSSLLSSSTQNQTKISPNSYIHTKLNDDYHIGNKINVILPQQRSMKAKQKYFVHQNGRETIDDDDDDAYDGGGVDGNGKRETRRNIDIDNKLNYAVCLRVIHFSRVNQ